MTIRKPLFVLQLYRFPRRIAEHAVEASLGEHLRKGQMPMEKLVMVCEALGLGSEIGGQRPPLGQAVQMALRDAAGATLAARFTEVLADNEGRAPRVRELLFVAVLLGLFVAAEG